MPHCRLIENTPLAIDVSKLMNEMTGSFDQLQGYHGQILPGRRDTRNCTFFIVSTLRGVEIRAVTVV